MTIQLATLFFFLIASLLSFLIGNLIGDKQGSAETEHRLMKEYWLIKKPEGADERSAVIHLEKITKGRK